MRRNRSFESIEIGHTQRKSKQFGSHLQPMSVHRPVHQRKLSCEEIINEMEKEQDAVVVRLLRELERVKEENGQLRKHLYQNRCSISRSNSEKDLVFMGEHEWNYHYSHSETASSPRDSLSIPHPSAPRARRPSPIGLSMSNSSQMIPIDTSMATQSLQKKRGSTSVAPNSSSSSILLTENGENNNWAKQGATDVDPKFKVPRRWSLSDETGGHFVGERNPSDATRRLHEYKLK